ncbi:MAG: hypothetical protein H6740_13420 [Alphaproteobacteria bacterium]|nr:hypothetical protein [Alphaproteobacteria bacterium]
MSEGSGPVESSNLSTIAAVAFVLALLSLAINFYNSQRVNEAIIGFAKLDVAGAQRDGQLNEKIKELESLQEKVGQLEAKVAKLEATEAAPAEGDK